MEANSSAGLLHLANGSTGNLTAVPYEEPDAEEVQHAVTAFYLVLVSANPFCTRWLCPGRPWRHAIDV